MAMYKDTDITVELIGKKFPAVASAIIAQASEGEPEITADLIRDRYPDIAASFIKEGEEKGLKAGAEAEAERLAAIEAVSMAGYEDIVEAAKKDSSKTADDVKLAIFDAMQAKAARAKSARAEDGANLAAQVAELNEGASGAEINKDKEAESLMAKAGKTVQGGK